MTRIILIIILIFIIYRLVKGLIAPTRQFKRKSSDKVIDEMVQDPVCKTYIPRRESVKAIIKGKEYYFCSESCAEKFKSEGRVE